MGYYQELCANSFTGIYEICRQAIEVSLKAVSKYFMFVCFAGVLKSSVAVEQRVGLGIKENRFIEIVKEKQIIVAVADLVSHNPLLFRCGGDI